MKKPVKYILIAEDNEDDVLLLREGIKRAGIQAHVQFVSDGEELLACLQKQSSANFNPENLPDLLILDLKMPRLGGLETLEVLQTLPHLKTIPKIVMSASSLDEDIKRAYERGANTYFVKPPTLDQLVQILTLLNDYWEKAGRIAAK